MELAGRIPVVSIDDLAGDMKDATETVKRQLLQWGFMAAEIPGIGRRTSMLLAEFRFACAASGLDAFRHTLVPQFSEYGNHGYFPFYSEIPRLAKGTADPKEHIHISGAMLEDKPPGAGAIFRDFPDLGHSASVVFDVAFPLIQLFGEIIGALMPPDAPALGLSRLTSILRVIHYRDVEGREVLAHEHSGIQMLGLQLPPSDQGLQYILHDGTWVEPVIANTDVVLCNVGRMLTAASNQRFRPSTHRVHNLSPSPGYERMSSVLFAYPQHDDRQWVATESGVSVKDETWGEFIRNRFRGISGPEAAD